MKENFLQKVLFGALKPTFREEIPPKAPVVNSYCWHFLQTNVERNNNNEFGENRLEIATSGAQYKHITCLENTENMF